MRYIKVFVWIMILSVLYANNAFAFFGIYTEPLLLFALLYSLFAKTFREKVVISVVCGIFISALSGHGFLYPLLFCVYSVLFFMQIFKGKLKQIFPLIPCFVFLLTFAYGALPLLADTNNFKEIISIAGAEALCSAVLTLIIYPLMKFTFTEKERYIF